MISLRKIGNGYMATYNGTEYFYDSFPKILEVIGQHFNQHVYGKPRNVIMEWFDARYSQPIKHGEIWVLIRKKHTLPEKIEEMELKIEYKGTFPPEEEGWAVTHWSPREVK